MQRSQRDQQEIGKGDAGQRDDEVELAGLAAEAGSDHRHDPRHEDLAEQHERQQHREQDREGLLCEGAHAWPAALGQRARGEWHEGGAKGAFGEQAAEQIGQALRHKERIRDRPGAKDRCGQDVADEAKDPAYQRIGADRGDRAEQSHVAVPEYQFELSSRR